MGCGGSAVRVESNSNTEPQHTSKGHVGHERQGDTSKPVWRSESENDPQHRNGPYIHNTQQQNKVEFGKPFGERNDTGKHKIDEVITASADEAEGDPQSGKEHLITLQQNNPEVGSTKKPPDDNNNDTVTRSLFFTCPPNQQQTNSQSQELTPSGPPVANTKKDNEGNPVSKLIPNSNGAEATPSSGLKPPAKDTFTSSSPVPNTNKVPSLETPHNDGDVSAVPSQEVIRNSNIQTSVSKTPLEGKKEPTKKENGSRSPRETNLERIRREALEVHNVYRVRHGVPPLVPSSKINKVAQRWAETMAKTGKFEHSPSSSRPGCGENIYCSGSTAFDLNAVTGGKATKAFYDEIDDYDFDKPGEKPASGKVIGHFTALIWRNSKEIGVGMATSKKGKWGHVYICCNYSPPGNYVGAKNYMANVPPLLPNIDPLEPVDVENGTIEDEDSVDEDKDELESTETAPSGVTKTHLDRIRLEVLEMHNVYRAKHGVPSLTPSKKINKYAQRWAETMAKTGKFEHSPGRQRPNCGENIYFAGSTNFDLANINGGQATTSFYDEIKDYNFKKPGEKPQSGKVIGHFTALVWKTSKELGVGMATSKKGKWGYVYICCNYSPPGNYIGTENYKENVLPPITGS